MQWLFFALRYLLGKQQLKISPKVMFTAKHFARNHHRGQSIPAQKNTGTIAEGARGAELFKKSYYQNQIVAASLFAMLSRKHL